MNKHEPEFRFKYPSQKPGMDTRAEVSVGRGRRKGRLQRQKDGWGLLASRLAPGKDFILP